MIDFKNNWSIIDIVDFSKIPQRKVVLFLSQKGKKPLLFRLVKYLVRIFSPKMKVIGYENLSEEPCIIIGNHSQMYGPIACELYFPENYYTWCAAPMMKLKEVPSYAYEDFWSQKPKALRPFFKLLSYLIAPISVLIFNNARTIAVFRDKHLLNTFKDSISKLKSGNNIVIFPEQDIKRNHIVYEFQEGFVDIARLYYKRTGKELSFVPLYIAPKLKKMFLGKPIKFSADTPAPQERRRICDYLMNEITNIAENLPEHTVVPYRNIPKRLYPKNIRKDAKK